GCSGLAMDPRNPDRLFAGLWDFRRKGWTFRSGSDGPNGVSGSGLYLTEDGGATWKRLDEKTAPGLPPGPWGRLDVAIAPSNPERVYAVIENVKSALYRSDDGANRWWKCNNLPVSQFYHASVDDRDPYQVYGGLQDNSSWVGDSEYPDGITNSRWENLYGGDGFWVFTDQSDPNFVYAEAQGGFIGRIDRHTLTARDIQPKAGYREKLHWNWNTPIHASRLEKGKVYVGAQFHFVTK